QERFQALVRLAAAEMRSRMGCRGRLRRLGRRLRFRWPGPGCTGELVALRRGEEPLTRVPIPELTLAELLDERGDRCGRRLHRDDPDRLRPGGGSRRGRGWGRWRRRRRFGSSILSAAAEILTHRPPPYAPCPVFRAGARLGLRPRASLRGAIGTVAKGRTRIMGTIIPVVLIILLLGGEPG